jgi:hypothetical protein
MGEGFDLRDIFVPLDLWPVLLQDLGAKRIDLHLPSDRAETGALKAKAKPFNPSKETADGYG